MGIWEGNSPNRNNVEIVNEPEQLIENNIINNFEQININKSPQLKTIIKVKNPFYLLKETFHLEKDANKNIYYIKFKYDSLINFNCYINFNVKKNEQRNNIKIKDDYELCYCYYFLYHHLPLLLPLHIRHILLFFLLYFVLRNQNLKQLFYF